MMWLSLAGAAVAPRRLVRLAAIALLTATCSQAIGQSADEPLHDRALPASTPQGDAKWLRLEHGDRLAVAAGASFAMPDLVDARCGVVWTKLQRFPKAMNVFVKWDSLSRAKPGTIIAQAPKPGTLVDASTRIFIRLAGAPGSGSGQAKEGCEAPAGSAPAAAVEPHPAPKAATERRGSSHPSATPVEPPQPVRQDGAAGKPAAATTPAAATPVPAPPSTATPAPTPPAAPATPTPPAAKIEPGAASRPGHVSVASRSGRDGVLVAYPADWLYGVRRDGRVLAWPPQGWVTRTGPDGWMVPYPVSGWTSQTGSDGRIVPYPNTGWTAMTGTDGRVVPYPTNGWKATAGRDGRLVPHPANGWSTALSRTGRVIAFPAGGKFNEDKNGLVEIFDSQGRDVSHADAFALRAKLIKVPVATAETAYASLLLDQMGYGTEPRGARQVAVSSAGAAPPAVPAGLPAIGPRAVPPPATPRLPGMDRNLPRF